MKHSAVANLERKTRRYLLACVVIGISGGVISWILVFLTYQNVTRTKSLELELSSFEQSQSNSEGIRQYIIEEEDNIQRLLQVFPNDESIVDFLNTFQALVVFYDPEAKVNFSSFEPEKVSNQLSIPISISASMTTTQLSELLRIVEKLPYILEISNLNITTPGGIQSTTILSITGRVYVQEPFL